jgi:hypothetical protein
MPYHQWLEILLGLIGGSVANDPTLRTVSVLVDDGKDAGISGDYTAE